jgi:predicted GIY-YIG superfamily endonuclease
MPLTRRYVTLEETIKRVVPEVRGVYALFNEYGVLIYYGSSDDLRTTILEHKKGKISVCTWPAWYFSFEVCTDAVTREKELLNDYKNKYARLPHCNELLA